MSDDQTQTPSDEVTEPVMDQLTMLKQRARMMGIEFSNNIGIDALRQKIEAKREGTSEPRDEPEVVVPELVDPSLPPVPEGKVQTLRQKIQSENMRLIRVRVTNLDPKKKDLPGEIMTVANEYLGTVRKFVPFGEHTDEGYHIPYCIYKYMKSRKFLNIRTYKDRKNNNQIKIEQTWAQEFALEVLPQLTQHELNQLATTQAAAGGLS